MHKITVVAFVSSRAIPQSIACTSSYIDAVGNTDMYRNKLERVFAGKGMTFVVEKKADANYAPCSAASVGKCHLPRE